MMKELNNEDDEVVSLIESEEKAEKSPSNSIIRPQFIPAKLFYFFFFSAQGSLMPYISLYYKQLRLTASETGIVSGAKMYVAFVIIPLWSFLVDKFKIGKLVFVMSSAALMTTMLTISMAPVDICLTRYNSSTDGDNISRSNTQNIFSSKAKPFAHDDLFLFLLLVTICGTIFSCPCLSLADSATVDILANNNATHKYGQQRMWGSLGNGLAAFIIGSAISQTNLCPGGTQEINYYVCFYIFAVFVFLAIIAGCMLRFNPTTKDSRQGKVNVCKSLLQVLANADYMIFLFTVFFDGVAMSFIKAFLFWFLKDLGGSQFLFSVITAVNCSMEVTVYFLSSHLIKRFGSIRVLCIGLVCYVIRFSFYAFLVKPWLVLIVEPLSGITTAALWAAIMSHVGTTALKDSAVTLQGVIHCLHWGLGHGSGAVVGGILVHNVGSRNTFAIFAAIGLFNFFLYLLVVFSKRTSSEKEINKE